MLIHRDNQDFVVDIKTHVCEHHKRQPWDVAWAGCTCSTSYGRRLATPAERAANLKARKEEEERRRKHTTDYDAGKLQ